MSSTGKDLYVDRALSNVAIDFRPQGMIADVIAPIVRVPKQSGAVPIFSIADAYRTEDASRAPATEANIVRRTVTSATFYCDKYSLKDYIPDEDFDNADPGMKVTERSDRTEFVTNKLLLDWENRVATLCTNTSNVGSWSATASAWTDYTNSDPILDINTAIQNVEGLIGVRPNRIIIGGNAWDNFKENSSVITRIYGNLTGASGRLVTAQNAAALFEVDQLLVGRAFRNTADEGQAAALSRLWADHVLVYYAPMAASRNTPSFMYSFRWGKGGMQMTTKRMRDEKREAESIEVTYYQDEKVTFANAGFLITNANSSQ